MSNFKVGDEVAKSDNGPWFNRHEGHHDLGPSMDEVFTVIGVELLDDCAFLRFSEFPDRMYNHRRFRKVQRRDLSVWLNTSVGNTDKLDKRVKEKAK